MPDFRRQRDTARAERDEALQQLEDLRAITGWIEPAYAKALRDHAELAPNAIRRISAGVNGIPESRPPSYDARAYNDLRRQKEFQRRQAEYLRRRLRHLVDGDHDPDDGATEMPTRAQPRGEKRTA